MLIVTKTTPNERSPTCQLRNVHDQRRFFKSLENGLSPLRLTDNLNTHENVACLIKTDVFSSLPNLACSEYVQVADTSMCLQRTNHDCLNDTLFCKEAKSGSSSFQCKPDSNGLVKDRIHDKKTTQNEINETRDSDVSDGDEFDVERDSDMTLLKDSPRSTSGKTSTLDSGICSLGRTDSFGKTDVSSFSSVSSVDTGNECSIINDEITEENAESVTNIINKKEQHEQSELDHCSHDSLDVKQKRKSATFGNFLSRGLFSRKNKDEASSGVWRLFGNKSATPPCTCPSSAQEPATKDTTSDVTSLASVDSTCSDIGICGNSGKCVKKSDIEVPSTSGLILQQRPSGLPGKDPEEELRHKQLHEQMIQAAKKKKVPTATLR